MHESFQTESPVVFHGLDVDSISIRDDHALCPVSCYGGQAWRKHGSWIPSHSLNHHHRYSIFVTLVFLRLAYEPLSFLLLTLSPSYCCCCFDFVESSQGDDRYIVITSPLPSPSVLFPGSKRISFISFPRAAFVPSLADAFYSKHQRHSFHYWRDHTDSSFPCGRTSTSSRAFFRSERITCPNTT